MDNILEPNVIVTLSAECCKKYKGTAFDGQFLYLTIPQEKNIHKFNRDFTLTGCYEVNRPYSAICYDNTENCFWASDEKLNNMIYKLNNNLEEIDRIKICKCEKPSSEIVGLSYNCKTNTIFIASMDFVAELSKSGQVIQILKEVNTGSFSSVLVIPPYYAVVRICEQTQDIDIFSLDGCLIKNYNFPSSFTIEDIVFDPCSEQEKDKINFIILATKRNSCPHLLKCKIESYDMELCKCNYKCSNKPCKCEQDKNKDENVSDFIESIALVETALSHILNAEGEKLQKAVEIACNVCELLEVNKSVNKTITNITFLEQILYAKLQAVCCLQSEKCHDEECDCQCKKK
jgi:hypothetical protein